jgi:malonate transporter and related proteins
MNISLEPIAIVFAFIMVGFICHKRNWITHDQIRGLSFFAMNIALPCLILKSFARINLAEIFDPDIYLSYYLSVAIIFFTGLLIARYFLKVSSTTAGLLAMGGCFCNLGLIGLPLVQATFGEKGVAVLAIVLSIHPAVLFTLTIATIEFTSQDKTDGRPWYKPLLGLFKNTIILAVLSGGTLSLLQVQLPHGVLSFLTMMSGAAGPCALFCVGGFLARANLSNIRGIITAVPLKVVIMPALVYFVGRNLFDLEYETAMMLSFVAGLPTGANVATLSLYYHEAESEISSVISAATLCSLATLPILIWIAS